MQYGKGEGNNDQQDKNKRIHEHNATQNAQSCMLSHLYDILYKF